MGTGTFAAVVIVGVMLLLLISIFIRQKKSDEATIRRKVRSTLIEETTGVSINERLKAKRKSISRPENVDFCELRSAKRLDLPERVDGWLDLIAAIFLGHLEDSSSPRIVLRRNPLDSRRAVPFPEL